VRKIHDDPAANPGRGHAGRCIAWPYRVPLSQFTDDAGAELVVDATVGIDDAAGRVRLRDGGERPFDALIVAPGARAVSGVEGAVTWWPGGDPEAYSGLLRDIDKGYSKHVAIVVPPGAVWPLPAYELALMTARVATAMGHDDVTITVVTPERRALSLFGDEASAAVSDELARPGVQLKTGVVGLRDKDGLTLAPGGERVDAQRVYSVPRCSGRRSRACRPMRRGSSSRATTRGSRVVSARGRRATRSSPPSSSAASPPIRRVVPRRRSHGWPASRTPPIRASPCSTAVS
jgi:hypothetical protein